MEETTNTSRSFSPQYTLLSLGVNKQVDISAVESDGFLFSIIDWSVEIDVATRCHFRCSQLHLLF